jgi:hypothetical protein
MEYSVPVINDRRALPSALAYQCSALRSVERVQLDFQSSIALTLEDNGVTGLRLSEAARRPFEFHNDTR